MSKRTFLLGAGFSQLAGLPLAKDLMSFVSNKTRSTGNVLDSEYSPELEGFIEKCQDKLPWVLSDVELFFTYIDLAIMGSSTGIFGGLDYDRDKLRLFRMKLSGAIVRAFTYAHFDFAKENDVI
jgi:hypothetical protein